MRRLIPDAVGVGIRVAVGVGSPSGRRRGGAVSLPARRCVSDDGATPRDWKTPDQIIDGIPLVNYGSFVARNPVTAAQYGLANYSIWRHYGDTYRFQIATRDGLAALHSAT